MQDSTPSRDVAAHIDREVVLYPMPEVPLRLSFRHFCRRSIFDWNRDFRPWAALSVLLIHAAVAYWLSNFGAGTARNVARHAIAPWVLQVVFLPARAAREHGHKATTTQPKTMHETSDVAIIRTVSTLDGKVRAPVGTAIDQKGTEPLRLQLPDAPVVVIGARDPLSRPTPVEYVPTRFEGRWITQGDAIAQAAWRHKSVAIALSLFGGGGHICTEDDKRRRMRGCSPAIDAGLEGADPASLLEDSSSAH